MPRVHGEQQGVVGRGGCSERERALDVLKARLGDYYIHSTYEARPVGWQQEFGTRAQHLMVLAA